MHNAYQLGPWHDLYAMLGGSAAALAGLLFVAVSIQIGRIAKSPIFRARAWANTFLIVMLVVNAALVLTPQDTTALGVELCVPAIVFILFLIRTMVGVLRAGLRLPWRPFFSIPLNLVGVAAGVSLIMRRGGGIYLVTLEFIAIIVWVMFGAWDYFWQSARKALGLIRFDGRPSSLDHGGSFSRCAIDGQTH
jgi:modulator of FtsH protease